MMTRKELSTKIGKSKQIDIICKLDEKWSISF